ncbi:unnamed protein product [Cladocopium goreaui]|uniref:Uncharacterized protein n=1 Tax=Cladocopium goreaui TaxID=2562237 RepID=A0A9P1C424_9DINO|nr:unnamed protein product [Cladocopium goreaui]
MWRLLYKSRKAEPCPNQLSRIVQRPWGIADLKFFSDDDCQDEITGGNAMTSGGFDHFHPSAVDQDSYLTSRMVDDDPLSTWTANCRTGFYNTNTDLTNCSGSWVGMQFRDSEEVRCVSIVQSRWESARCCDAADELELQRWNGSSWIEASWFRRPPVPAVKTEFNFREPTHIGGTFANLGACPSRTSDKRMFEETIREQRSRRDSEKCIVQLTGAVTLLAEPYCIKHPRCVSVFGTMGTCCPIGDLVQSENRCCCGFLGSEPIFADEISLSSTRDKLSFEYSAIWVSNILPWIGLAVTVALYLTAVLMPAEMEVRCKLWIMEEMERTPGRRGRLLLKRLWVIGAWPWLSWRSFLATSKSQVSHMVRWFILPDGRLPKPLEMYRSLLFLIFGSILSGMAPWLLLGAICGEMMIWLALQLCQVIRYFKSPFDPLDLRDMQLRQNISRVMVKDDEGLGRAFDVAAGVATTIVYGLAFFGKHRGGAFIFDLLIVRAQMLSVEAIENIEADKVVELFPGLLETLQEPAMLLYDVGIPLCEGSCALAGSVALVMILYGASQWLNYDLFGLFVASRQVVKATRPECQRILAQSLILLCLGASFAAVQMTMVLFTRALAFANPFTSATWVCPYDDTLAIFVGRILLTGSSIIGVLFVFLCVNGHFVGQDYITERVAHFLGIDLAELDPDGTGEEGGMFRFDVFGAALPTLFGVWWDPWNIDAYLVRERAHVYSMELRDPQACKHCEKIHVQYELMMTATGRTVSAAVQIVPYGAVVAKACEYLNDPPLIYIGTKMSCMRVRKLELTHTKGTKNVLMWSLLFIASILAYSIEYAVPFLKRVTSVMMLVYLFMGTFTLTERNLVDQGTYVILSGFTLSFVKAALEKLVPALLSYGLSGVYFVISRAEGTLTHRNDIARTLTGQALSGATCATLVSGSALAAQWQSPAVAVLLGATVGYAFSLLTLLINVLFEQPSPDIDQKVPRTMFQFIMKIGAALLTGGLVALVVVFAGEAGLAMEQPEADSYEFQNLLGERWGVRGSISLAILPLAVQFIVFRLVLVENLPPKARESINPDYDWRDSPTWVVLRTVQFFPNLTAIPTCALVTVLLRDLVKSVLFLSPIQHQLLMTGAGVVVANVSAMTVHRLMESFPQLVGFFACVLSACLLCPWNFLFGAFTAVWIGVAVGSVLEEVVLRRMLQKEIKRRKETGEKDSTFFDTERAIMMEQWEQIDEPEEVTPVPSEPTREEKLDAYLQIAAQGLSPIDYARDWEEQREQERIEAQTPRRSTKSQSFLQIEGDGVDDGVDDDLDDLDAEPGAEMLGDGDVGVLEDEGLEGATSSCMERAPSGLAEDKPMVLFFNAAALEDISPSAKASAAPSKEEPKGDRLPTEMQALEAPEEVPAVEQGRVEVESAPRHDDGGEAVADEGFPVFSSTKAFGHSESVVKTPLWQVGACPKFMGASVAGALEIATPRDADAQLADLPELAELRAAAVGLVGEQSMSIDLALARRQPSQTHSLEQASLMVLGGGGSIRDEFELEDGFDFSREDPVEEPESKKPSKAISSRSFGGTSSLAQAPASPSSPVSPSRDLNPGLLSMQRPPGDLWSRTHGRAPTATSLRSMAQQVQKSLATASASGTLNPPSPSSPSSPSKRGQARRPSPRIWPLVDGRVIGG